METKTQIPRINIELREYPLIHTNTDIWQHKYWDGRLSKLLQPCFEGIDPWQRNHTGSFVHSDIEIYGSFTTIF